MYTGTLDFVFLKHVCVCVEVHFVLLENTLFLACIYRVLEPWSPCVARNQVIIPWPGTFSVSVKSSWSWCVVKSPYTFAMCFFDMQGNTFALKLYGVPLYLHEILRDRLQHHLRIRLNQFKSGFKNLLFACAIGPTQSYMIQLKQNRSHPYIYI